MSRWLKLNLPVIFWAFLIFLGSSLPGASVSSNSLINFVAHKIVHLFEYAVLYFFYYRSRVEDFWESHTDKILMSLFFVVIYGAFDEYHQFFVPGRQPRTYDVFIDLLGGLLGLALWWFLRQRKLRKPNA